MANIVTNILRINGELETMNMIIEKIKGDNEAIDFNKIIPMPEEVFVGPLSSEKRLIYGENNWYDWSRKHWGTKWNAYDSCYLEEEGVLYFSTAWNTVPNVISKLSQMFPKETFILNYADEDIGYNTGCLVYRDGDTIVEDIKTDGSKEAEEYAENVTDLNLEKIDYNGGFYYE